MSIENNNKLLRWLRKYKRIIIGLFTIVLIIVMILIVDFNKLISKIYIIGIFGIFIFIIGYTFTFFIRGYKLKLIFKGLNRGIKYSTSFFSIGISFVINELTPTKIGDLAKIAIIKDIEDIRLSESIGGSVIERFLDLFALFSVSLVAFTFLYFSNKSTTGTKSLFGLSLQFYVLIGVLLMIMFFFFLFFLLFKTEFSLRIIRKFSSKLSILLERFLVNFKRSLKSFKDHRLLLLIIILLEVLLWITESLIGVMFFYLLGYDLNLFILVLAMLFTYFSKSFSITPGGWGISENLGTLFLFFIYPEIIFAEILSVFIIEHLFRSTYIFFLGGYSIFHYNLNLKKLEMLKTENT